MASKNTSSQVAIGMRVKTGRATAIVVAGPPSSPIVVARKNLQLFDPAIPESHQPYHAELELPPEESARAVPRALAAVRQCSIAALRDLLDEVRAAGHSVVAIALVAGSGADPESIRNPHMRAHAREGQLFPRALADASTALGIRAAIVVEATTFADCAAALKKSEDSLKRQLAELGRAVGKPWSSEEKSATAAALTALAR
ncbi:MAG TPA: hypothetical protein VEU51_18125 [Candidatus Acidoferrales bacterium]|nr:hypothetical protein [Candidatus Acidoferrales bacterium]